MDDIANALRRDAKEFVKRRKIAAVESVDPLFEELQKQAATFVNRPKSVAVDDGSLAKQASRFAQSRGNQNSVGFFAFDIRTPNKRTFSEEEVVFCWVRDFLGRRDAEKNINSGLAKAYRSRVIAEMLNEIDAWIPVSWYRS